MTVPLFRFPLLVLKIILIQLDLYEIFSLATTSEKTKKCMKIFLSRQRFTIFYEANRSITLTRGIPYDFTCFNHGLEIRMIEKPKQKLVYPYQIWKFLGQDAVSVRVAKRINTLIVVSYWEDRTDALHRMVQFFADLLTRPQLRIYFFAGVPDYFRSTVRFLKNLVVEVVHAHIEPDRGRRRAVHNELMRIAIEECLDVKKLKVHCENTQVDLKISQPINCDWISIGSAEWVTKEQLVEQFFNCQTVFLLKKNYEDRELAYIFEKWISGSRIKFLYIEGSTNFYFRKSLTNIVGQLPGATSIEKALVLKRDEMNSDVFEFGEGRCYLIKQTDGERDALVYIWLDGIHLTETYQIGEDVDEMDPATSESEPEDFDDGRPVVEEEDDESDQDNILYGEYGEEIFEDVQEAPGIERRNSDHNGEDEDGEEDNAGSDGDSDSDSEGDNGDDEDSERDDDSEEDDDSD